MEDVLKKIIDAFEGQIKITEALVIELKNTIATLRKPEGVRRTKRTETPPPAPETEKPATPEPEPKPATTQPAAPALVPVPEQPKPALLVGDVTIEMIRERSVTYSDSKNFGMDGWIALAQKVTGQKKVKDIPKEMYGAFFAAMGDGLEKLKTDRAPLNKPSLPALVSPATPIAQVVKTEITIEQVREKAAKFIEVNGQPSLVALVKQFGGTKISEIAKEKYPAFLEALTNA